MEEWEKLQNLETIGKDDPLNRSPPYPTVMCSFYCTGRNFRVLPRNFRTPRNAPGAPKKRYWTWAGTLHGTSGGRNFRPKTQNFRPSENWQKLQNENGHIFCIRTPFSMILGSLESSQRAQRDYAEKHHGQHVRRKPNG